jgi:type IV pilus biogenesis protein CpaD/CtpE
MLKCRKELSNRLLATAFATAICLPLAGCLNAEDPWGEGSLAYTVDETYPIGGKHPCGQYHPDLGNDVSNHMSYNHGCAVHANITAMIADPSVIKHPKRRLPRSSGQTAVTAITSMQGNAAGSTTTSNGAKP